VLLYGPPGTGKTLLARALAHECGRRFLAVSGPEVLTMWFGESERAVRDLFARARALGPAVLFVDEIDALVPRRSRGARDGATAAADRVVDQVLAELDGVTGPGAVTVVGATNDIDRLDRAVLRPGRLGLHIEVPLPDAAGRRRLLEHYLQGSPATDDDVAASEGMAGADIAMVAREARLAALRRTGFRRAAEPDRADVEHGLARVRRSVSERRDTAPRGSGP
jgi:transitional endoplasmic reticulum ATPase